MRSMYSAVSSLKAHQLKMDTIGNNVANVNTVGYKSSNVTFEEVFNQTLQGASSAQEGRGGTNPMQVGLGADVAAISVNHTQGAVERTDVATDLMIDGEGFFMVSSDENFLDKSYTRSGNFTLDENGNLVTSTGMKVLGYMADETGTLGATLEGLKIEMSQTYDPNVTSEITLAGNLDTGTVDRQTIDDGTGNPPGIYGDPSGGEYIYEEKTKTVDGVTITYYELNDDYKDCVARETTIQAYDSLGGIHDIKLAFIKDDGDNTDGYNTWSVQAFYVKDDGSMEAANSSPTTPTITFNSYGNIDTSGGGVDEITYTLTGLDNGAEDMSFTVDLSNVIQFEDESDVYEDTNDGYTMGTLDSFEIGQTGEIVGGFTNGKTRVLGQIALAKFKNPEGLSKTSSNLFEETVNSGNAIIGSPGSSGFGLTVAGSLEMSNVDLSQEFTNMITTQRGFQANSRIITTTDEMLQELVNLKR